MPKIYLPPSPFRSGFYSPVFFTSWFLVPARQQYKLVNSASISSLLSLSIPRGGPEQAQVPCLFCAWSYCTTASSVVLQDRLCALWFLHPGFHLLPAPLLQQAMTLRFLLLCLAAAACCCLALLVPPAQGRIAIGIYLLLKPLPLSLSLSPKLFSSASSLLRS